MSGPDGAAPPVHAAAVPAIGVAAQGHPTHDELVAAVAAILTAGRRTGAAGAPGPAPVGWRHRRLAALGLSPRRAVLPAG
ncbi:hypothetical protein [Kineosporia sp. A_224]|uniref:hypothetical protein n=1 Tax=Kineosporia sp. A_224 TaxID=1962180 RepID=UPI000B4AE78F|nr:hypothetical protein [Kineosporia sp. A_224]